MSLAADVEQLPLLERPEVAADGMATALLLPDDLPELRAWIDECIGWCEGSARAYARRKILTGHSEPNYDIWPHAWVLRGLVVALPDAGRFAALVVARERGTSVDAREVRSLIAAVEAA